MSMVYKVCFDNSTKAIMIVANGKGEQERRRASVITSQTRLSLLLAQQREKGSVELPFITCLS